MERVTIDGSQGEGGGQILRTAAALAARTGCALVIENVRAGRSTPGLRWQHVHVLETIAQACNGQLEGATVGSNRIALTPGPLEATPLRVDMGTAASTPLLLEALAPLAAGLDAPLTVDARGGTDTKWAPTLGHLQHVFVPLARRAGVEIEILETSEGFYPKGGGRLRARIHPRRRAPWEHVLEDRGDLVGIEILVRQAQLPDHVGERIASTTIELLADAGYAASHRIEHVEARSPGVVVDAIATFEHTVMGSNALGERGKPSEIVARACADRLLDALESQATVDAHAADQLVPLLADRPGSGFVVRAITGHLETNVETAYRFLEGRAKIDRLGDGVRVAFQPDRASG